MSWRIVTSGRRREGHGWRSSGIPCGHAVKERLGGRTGCATFVIVEGKFGLENILRKNSRPPVSSVIPKEQPGQCNDDETTDTSDYSPDNTSTQPEK